MKTVPVMLLAGLALMACTPADEPADTAENDSEMSAPAATPAPPVDPAATPAPPVDTSADGSDDTCNMAQYMSLVGKPATDPAVPQAGAAVRIIHPGDQVTMDFIPTRLNIDVNDEGVITSIRCG